jgi:aspartyl protease family protein
MRKNTVKLGLAAALLAIGVGASAATPPSTTVPMKKDGGVYVVPVSVNGTVTLDCIVDSGASDVNIPSGVFDRLVEAGTIKKEDILGSAVYTLANGSNERGRTVRLRSLKVGNIVVKDVVASVGGAQSSALLGQSFLERFTSWSLDNNRHVLLLAGLPSAPPELRGVRSPRPDRGGPHGTDPSDVKPALEGQRPGSRDSGGGRPPRNDGVGDDLTAQHSGH